MDTSVRGADFSWPKLRTFGGHRCGPLMAISADFLVAMDTQDLGGRCGGRLFFVSRAGEMIKTSNANVSPAEVEMELQSLAVRCCVGVRRWPTASGAGFVGGGGRGYRGRHSRARVVDHRTPKAAFRIQSPASHRGAGAKRGSDAGDVEQGAQEGFEGVDLRSSADPRCVGQLSVLGGLARRRGALAFREVPNHVLLRVGSN